MDPTIKQMIDGYSVGFEAHRARLGEDHPEYAKAAALYDELRQAGEAATDFGSFFESAGGLFEEVGAALTALGEVPAPEGVSAGAGGGGSETAVLVSPYKARMAGFDRTRPEGEEAAALCERAISLGDQAGGALPLLTALAREAIPGRVAALEQRIVARDTGESAQGLSQPCLEHHYRVLGQTLEGARTETEVELEVNRLVELNSVENEWDTVLVHYLMKAIHETVGLLMDKSPTQQQTVENSYRFVCDFFGMDWGQVWAHPRVWSMWTMEYEKTKHAWVSERDCHTPEQARDFITGLFEGVMKERAPAAVGTPDGKSLVMWDRPTSLDEVPAIYSNPPRPEIDFAD